MQSILHMRVTWNAIIELEAELAPQGEDPALLRDQHKSSKQRYACVDMLRPPG